MSNLLLGYVFQLDLNPSLKLILMGLADAAGDDGGSCYPKVATLARKASISERQAQRNLKILRANDWCWIVGNEAGGRQTRRYQLNVQKLREKANGRMEAFKDDKLSLLKNAAHGHHLCHRKSVTGDTPAMPSMSPELPVELSFKKTTNAVAVGLVWPRKLSEKDVVVAGEIISILPPIQQQQRLDELSGAMDKAKGPRDPVSWLRQIVVGPFTPLLCWKVAADRERRAQMAADQEVARVAAVEAKKLKSERQARLDMMDESQISALFACNPDLGISSNQVEAWLQAGRPSTGHVAAAARVAISRRNETHPPMVC